MATYQYRCPDCGPFDMTRPMGRAHPTSSAPRAASTAAACSPPRCSPHLRPLTRALQSQEASAHEPRVVTEVPSARRRPTPASDPRQAQLPKP